MIQSSENKMLSQTFYLRSDVVQIARELIGKVLLTNFNGKLTSGMIVETEAYAGITDRASHAFGNRNTPRTKPMFSKGGISYVYLCYGIHSLFNVVTNHAGIPHAVLIRAIKPIDGLDIMLERSGKRKVNADFGVGPGKVSRLLGIHFSHSGTPLIAVAKTKKPDIWIEDHGIQVVDSIIKVTPRIGVDYAGEDAKLPYRFIYRMP
jgi:DNA-3-methyladenine glycosylase